MKKHPLQSWIGSYAKRNGGYKSLAKVSGYDVSELVGFAHGLSPITSQQVADICQAMLILHPHMVVEVFETAPKPQQKSPKPKPKKSHCNEFPCDDSAMFFSGCGGLPLLAFGKGVQS